MSIQKIRDILRIGARYIVAGALFHSGMRMVLNLAGIHSGPVEWVTPFGEFSGAQFAGMWLGVSPVFQTLGGLVEVVAGLFLLIPRTTTVGAMLAVGCIINSLMLDFSFQPSPWAGDVLLLLSSIYLLLLDWRVLVNLLLLDRPTTPISTELAWETPQTRKFGLALKICVLIYFIYASGVQVIQTKQDAEAQSELSGAYSVEAFSPPNADIQHRWQVAAIDQYAEKLTVRTVDGGGTTFNIQPLIPAGGVGGHREHVAAVAGVPGRLTLVSRSGLMSTLNYSRPSSGHLVLKGELDGVEITADLQLVPPESLPFVNSHVSFAEPHQ